MTIIVNAASTAGYAALKANAAEAAADRSEAAADSVAATAFALIPRVICEGDSIMAQNHAPTSGSLFGMTQARGELIWAHALFPYFEFDQWADASDTAYYSQGCNVAVGGNQTEQVIARLDTVSNLAPDIVCLAIGINDINGGDSAASTMANIETICAYYLSLGYRVLLGNLRPVEATYAVSGVDWSNDSARMVQRDALNAAIASYATTTPGVFLVDLAAAYSNGATPPRPNVGDMEDGLHPSATGAYRGGRAWEAALRKIIKPLAWSRPSGANIIGNGVFAGAGGTAGTGLTGDVAPQWAATFSRSGASGGSATASKNSADEQVIAFTPGGNAWEQVQISRQSGGAALQEGRWYKGVLRIRLSASAFWRGVWWQFSEDHAMGFGPAASIYTAEIPDNQTLDLFIETPVMQAGVGGETGAVVIRVAIDGAATGTPTLTVIEAHVAEVADPGPLHGLS